jgi:hypothetical protein
MLFAVCFTAISTGVHNALSNILQGKREKKGHMKKRRGIKKNK